MTRNLPAHITPALDQLSSEYQAALAATTYWAAQDVEMAISTFSSNIVYRLFFSRPHNPFVFERIGHEQVREMLYDALADFDYLNFDATILEAGHGRVRIQSQYTIRHQQTGDELSGTKRYVCEVENGKFTRINEYQDSAILEAFLKLARWRMQQDGLAIAFRTVWPLVGR